MDIYMFWLIVVGICILWYSTVTLFVAIRGGKDIKDMMLRLQKINDDDEAADEAAREKASSPARQNWESMFWEINDDDEAAREKE